MENKRRKIGFFANLAEKLSNIKHLPRWVIFTIDAGIVACSLAITYFLMNVWGVPNFGSVSSHTSFIIMFAVSVLSLIVFRVSSGVVRHSSIRDITKISLSTFAALIVLFIIGKLWKWKMGSELYFDFCLIFFILTLFLALSLFRFYVKLAFALFIRFRDMPETRNIVIYGTGSQAVGFGSAITENPDSKFNLLGFIEENPSVGKGRILGKKIYSFDQISKLKEKSNLKGIIFSEDNIKAEEFQPIIEDLIKQKIRIYHLPVKLLEQEKGEQSAKIAPNIKTLQIEDLLYRKEIKIENSEISQRHLGKVVLVTGGAGSIGSEIVRKVSSYHPSKVIVVDQAETPLNDIKLEMQEKFPHIDYLFYLADVSNKHRIEKIFKENDISMVYHAAAYKHVPVIEDNPIEAINVNIWGSRILADLASKYKVNRFVMISTDKAVNPTNVMGASKRVAELYVQSLQELPGNTTKFITTRFGNVLGSNGSVIPLFRKQIEEGGPVTVTHEEITRFFMTIPEACELVLQAGVMGQGGEIYVFDMGEPVKIIDLARKMIQLSGLTPGKDIEIKVTGLRPGEKLYEELLSNKTTTLPTHHEKIMRSKDERVPYEIIEKQVTHIARRALVAGRIEIVKLIKEIVPEYISKNSQFEFLDNK
ncbi:polysaccharide biosynthesis protein [Ornithobacterium rhinotracheale]|uniref:polysaccharide biosynthesis protein n=1 Tax=Ornithobacterium rhinotracheale TaxID=28251 RepID=UPI00129CBCA8|nr:nucleoside-diphosphate sugar epimerase/dehydratase [Ornithobacterium rhinotracheale]MRJ07515.1 polysaccharide biosynthesis protein [Ornithobacterium rhinotracheale]UOH78109.1 polysaccharide biosynthesis protein [Ornithobacterium rhinotracheale]